MKEIEMEKKRTLGKFSVALVLFMVFAFLSSSVTAKTYRWVMGAGHPDVALGGLNVFKVWYSNELSKRIKAATGDNVKWVYAFGGAIAKVGDELEALEQGTLTFGPVQYPFEWAKLPMGGVFYQVPFSSSDQMVMNKIGFDLHMKVAYMRKALIENNVKYIGHMGWDSYQLVTTFPVRSMADLKNRKISGAGPNLEWIKAAGAVPVQGNLTEWYTSMQTGVVDGVLATVSWMKGFKFYEVAKYCALTEFGAVPGTAFGMNLDEFNDLPKKIQDIIINTGAEIHIKVAERGISDYYKAWGFLEANGVKFYQFTFDQKKEWANRMPNIPARFVKTYEAKGIPAGDIVRFVIEAQKQAGHKFPREWKLD